MNLIDQLIESRKQTESYFTLSEIELKKTYGKGKWNVRQILVHLADAESVLHERIKRAIAEPNQVVFAFDPDLWCENLDYENFPLDISKSLYSANRQSIIYLTEKYYQTHGNNEFEHSKMGLRTLKDEFEKVASHNQGHINQIELALNK